MAIATDICLCQTLTVALFATQTSNTRSSFSPTYQSESSKKCIIFQYDIHSNYDIPVDRNNCFKIKLFDNQKYVLNTILENAKYFDVTLKYDLIFLMIFNFFFKVTHWNIDFF